EEAASLNTICQTRRRLELPCFRGNCTTGCRRIDRHPYKFAGDGAARGGGSAWWRTRTARTFREGTRCARSAHGEREKGEFSILHDDDRAAANGRLWGDGLAGWPRGMDPRASRLRAVGVRQQS